MPQKRDPIQRAADGRDLYDVASWEERTAIDHLAARLHGLLTVGGRWSVIALAVVILAAQFLIVGVAAFQNPLLGVYVLLSIVPAAILVFSVWRMDVTMREPLSMLVGTFVLGFLFAGFASVLNTVLKDFIAPIAMVLFFFVVVGPVEETVKWLAVRLYAYRSERFDAVIDGAVYGAAAGLGFATIENTIYITNQFLTAANSATLQTALGQALQTATLRTFAGPGHVIYSAFAGYYLGLAKFNSENRGPIVVKGLLIAATIHAAYNTVVTYAPQFFPNWNLLAFIGFVLVYDGVFLLVLYRKLSRYRDVYTDLDAGKASEDPFEDLTPAVEYVGDET
ncbi:PrsW family intramembrane metalloprotease [Halarchaeum nitratireducens]|uniref:PrsW family intramembrane metalloprotease n=1 Tax=Halarchaeum nitratireducens TaxID=489913 RepID=A0A830GAH7_9EURY|nr:MULTISPECIES: PrsW family intramembrane metalloprotease [Halarchaeum]MBP2250373.1 RsiW-degrading membrane proteinase PrsW (M82 family) [Halarchaeum solikamskense]GGN13066.1 PrsW family intramembrane metalloprotease [Halarchaeum nitratireducens]